MEKSEIDKLVSDIQEYLNRVDKQKQINEIPGLNESQEDSVADAGLFIPSESRLRMKRFLKYSRYASYAVEALTIALLTSAVLSPFHTWQQTTMFLMGVLLFSIFTITVLIGLQARIRLLLQIELNTYRIAISKRRIAEVLEKLQTE